MNENSQEAATRSPEPKQLPEELTGITLPTPTLTSSGVAAASRKMQDWKDQNPHNEFATHVHDYVQESVRFADQKAAFVASFASAMLAFLQTQGLLPALGLEFSFLGLIRALAALGLALGILLSAYVIVPRRQGNISGLVFWRAIARKTSAEAYEAAVRASAPEDLDAQLACHTYEVAQICDAKYKSLTWAMLAGVVGLMTSVLLILASR